MASIINATTTNGVAVQGDNSGSLQLQTNNGTTAVTINTSQNVGIGTASPTFAAGGGLNVANSTFATMRARGGSSTGTDFAGGSDGKGYVYVRDNADLIFGTNNTERMRIISNGELCVNGTATSPATADAEGVSIGNNGSTQKAGVIQSSAASNAALYVNRKTDDGNLVQFYQAAIQEGSISVSGNTVSYNAFAGSHWSQLSDGSKPEILRGTVMESINELCEWPDEPTSERLCRVKISDTTGSKKVYGVFMDWDNDWTATNDMLVTAVGAFICRINKDVVVQEGDLLESNGDGTAKVQADDIMRSSTIGKVTCTEKTHEYDDGSYCVPTVLYCG